MRLGMTCVSLTACAAEQHPRAACIDCGAATCELALERGRCIPCVARRLREARAAGRIDRYGLPTAPGARDSRGDAWGSVELVLGPPLAQGRS